MGDAPFTIFISYSHQDKKFLREIEEAFRPFQRLRIRTVSDGDIAPGTDWLKTLEHYIDECDAALLLVSQHFLASQFISEVELPRTLELRQARGLRVFWVPIATSSIHLVAPQLYQLQATSTPSKPIGKMGPKARGEKFVEFANWIVGELSKGRPSQAPGAGRKFALNVSHPFVIRDDVLPRRFVVLAAGQKEVELPFALPKVARIQDLTDRTDLDAWSRVAEFADHLYSRLRDVHLCLQDVLRALERSGPDMSENVAVAADHHAHASSVLVIARRTVLAGEKRFNRLSHAVRGAEPFRVLAHLRDCHRALEAGMQHPLEEAPTALKHYRNMATFAGVLCAWLLQLLELSQQVLDGLEPHP